jgi:hypothetical protein
MILLKTTITMAQQRPYTKLAYLTLLDLNPRWKMFSFGLQDVQNDCSHDEWDAANQTEEQENYSSEECL